MIKTLTGHLSKSLDVVENLQRLPTKRCMTLPSPRTRGYTRLLAYYALMEKQHISTPA